MKRVVEHNYACLDSAQSRKIVATRSKSEGLSFKWLIVLFLASVALACALRSDAAASIQIQAGSAANVSRCIVRTSGGNLYAVVLDTSSTATVRVYRSTNGGSSWAQQDAAHAPSNGFYQAPSAAIDANGIIHIAYWNLSAGLRYVTFSTSTNTFSGDAAVIGVASTQPNPAITAVAVDSNNATHITYGDGAKSGGNTYNTVNYINNVGGSWNSKVQVYGAPTRTNGYVGDILINQNNVPQLSYLTLSPGWGVGAAIGNVNKATSFTTQLVVSFAPDGLQQPSIVLDSANNTWVGYVTGASGGGSLWPGVIEHRASDPWSTWQTAVQDSAASIWNNFPTVGLAANGTTLYIAYPSSSSPNNVVWQSYNGSSWSTVAALDKSAKAPVLKWSQYFNNGSSSQIDVLITSSAGAYWNEITSTISGLSANSGPAGTPVTISGSNFGASQGSSTVTFNGVVATPSSWSPGSIVVNVPAAASTGPLVVTVGGAPSNPVNFTVLVPSISNLSVTSGPVGTPVTITGLNFGTSQGTSTVTFNGTLATPTSWNSTSIGTAVPGGATSGPVVVTVGGTPTNSLNFTVTPGITNISPPSASTGTTVTITGTSFGATQGTSTLTFNGVVAAPTSWTGTQIQTPIPAAATSGPVVVTVGGTPSNSYTYNVLPTVSSISPTTGGVGTYVVLSGSGFGITRGTSTVTFNGATANPSGWSSSSITVPVPSNATTGPILVTVNGQASNGITFTYTGNGTISGSATRASDGSALSGMLVQALQNGSQVASATTGADGSYSIPNLAAGTYDLTASLTGYLLKQTGNLVTAGKTTTVNFSLVVPTLGTVTPGGGASGTVVTITGSNFGPSQGTTGLVSFNGVYATVSSWSAGKIVATVPAGATTGPVVVTVNSVDSNGINFTIGLGGISGTVTQVSNGAAISGATVTALQSNSVVGSATSGSDGTYSIASLSPGTYDVRVSAAGFGTTLQSGNSVTGGSTTTVNAALPSPGTLSGTVTQSNGTTPITGATVTVNQGTTTVGTASTNSSGNYSLASLSAGSYSVQASAAGYTAQIQSSVSVTAGNTTTSNFNLLGQSAITYAYDGLGRLVGVSDSQGSAATYSYDAVGNLLSIATNPSSQTSIMGFTPASGSVGTVVTINGTGFSTTASQDSVQFNGTAATVSSATVNQLVVTVPNGATTGTISVTAPSGTATSNSAFQVNSSSGQPSISGFSPTIALAGTALTVNGVNFDTTKANDRTDFNGALATITSATTTALSTTVPNRSASGRISVSTALGRAVSSSDFFIVPSGYTPAQVVYTGRISMGGSTTASINTVGGIGLLLFDGSAGQQIVVQTSNSTFSSCNLGVTIITPTGSTLASNGCMANSTIPNQTLPTTGTYTVILTAENSSTGSTTVAVSDDSTNSSGSLVIGGSPVTVNITVPGKPTNLTFIGRVGQNVSLNVTNGTFGSCGIWGLGAQVTIINPDGTTLGSTGCFPTAAFIDTTTLPQTGAYTVSVFPNSGGTGSATLTLYAVPADVSGTLTAGTPLNVSVSTPGQNVTLTFSGTSGQAISLNITNGSFGGCFYSSGANLTILNPDGTTLISYGCFWNATYVDVTTLNQTGTYKVKADLIGASTGSFTATLYNVPSDVTGTLIPGTPLNVSVGTPGQNVTLTFSGTSGQRISLNINNSSFGGCVYSSGANLTILNPDGTTFGSYGCFWNAAFVDASTLTQTGTYKVKDDLVGASTGSFTTTLYNVPPDAGGPLTANTPLNVSVGTPGQNATMTFNATSGQTFGLNIINGTFGPCSFSQGAYLTILNPDSTTFGSYGCFSTTTSLGTQTFSQTGNYSIKVDPYGFNVGNFTITLTSP